MIDQRFMQSLADDMKDPMLGDETTPEMVLAAGPARTDAPQAFVGTRLNVPKAGQAQPTTQDRERLAVGLLDSLAGALRGAAAQTLGLPGDIRSIVDMINQEGAEKYLGQRSFATTEEILQDTSVRIPGTTTDVPFPPVLGANVPRREERQPSVETAQEVGTFLPAPGIPEAVVKGGKMIGRAVQATKNMPIGMSTQIVGEGVSDLGFYSAAKQAVDSIQQPKGTGDQFLKQIEKTPGVKPEEIKWTGLDDFLKSKKSVTKAEVQEFLDKNRVEIKEVRLGEQETYDPARLKQLEEEYANLKQHPIDDPSFGEAKYDEMIRLMNIRDRSTTDSLYRSQESAERAGQRAQARGMPEAAERYFRQAELFGTRAEKLDLEGLGMEAPTKFSKYTLPGGENYREILITLPFKEPDMPKGYQVSKVEYDDGTSRYFAQTPTTRSSAYKTEEEAQAELQRMTEGLKGFRENLESFKSQHFDQPNILAHMRVNDRVDKDGKKVLFIEEVQSDWHQAGRKKGYQTKLSKEESAELEALYKKEKEGDGLLFSNDADRLTELENKSKGGVPDAPFKTTWHELAMKRAIQLAAEGGYDRVAFTTGKTQAERYDLSKQVKMISAMPDKNGKYNIYIEGKDGDPVFRNTNGFSEYGQKVVTPEEFEELVGKDAAKTIMQKADELNRGKVSKDQFKFYDSKPADLTIGGEGMKGFYDQILPKFLDKYAKKWDAKTGQMNMFVSPRDGSVPINYIDVTPKMKESVLTKGQPLFAIGAGGAAVQQEENQ